MTKKLDLFRKDYLEANTWAQRREGVPLDLLDNLSDEELKIAEAELIRAASLKDNWPIIGLGHIKSKDSLPILYGLLEQAKAHMKVTIAHSIFQISEDKKMIDIVLEETPKISDQYRLIDILYFLRDFKDKRTIEMLNNFRDHKEYLVAYNATRYLGLPTDEVVERFINKTELNNNPTNLWRTLLRKLLGN